MTSSKPTFMAGARKIESNGSIRLDAIRRSIVAALAMVGGGICTMVGATSQNPLWLGAGMLALPFVVIASRRCQFVFDVPKRALLITGSFGDSRHLGFDEIRTFDLVNEKASGPWILTINEEPLCWVQRTYANQDLKTELAAVLAPPP